MKGRLWGNFLCAFVCFLLSFSTAQAFESRFAIRPGLDLNALARSGQIVCDVHENRGVIDVDASAVLKVNPRKFLDVSLDYDHYKDMRIPHLDESHVVEREPN